MYLFRDGDRNSSGGFGPYYPSLLFPLTKIQESDTDEEPPNKRQRQRDWPPLPYNSDPPFMGASPLALGSDLETDCDLETAVSSRL